MTWTKVTDALPPDGEAVMVTVAYNREKAVLCGKFECGRFLRYSFDMLEYFPIPNTFRITHWISLPQPAED